MSEGGRWQWKAAAARGALVVACAAGLARHAAANPDGWQDARAAAGAYGFAGGRSQGRVMELRRGRNTLRLEADSRRMVFNDVQVYLNGPVVARDGRFWVTDTDVDKSLGPLWRPADAVRGLTGRVVVLDPGHGGEDPGACGGSWQEQEKAITLDVARRTREILRQSKVLVFLTRERDQTVSLEERGRRARQVGADVFVSIHLNVSPNRAVTGVETYILPAAGYPATAEPFRATPRPEWKAVRGNRYDAANLLLAYCLQRGMVAAASVEDRGVRRARFYVLRNAACPAALVECGFLSNAGEARRWRDEDYRDRMAGGLARGILTYLWQVREANNPAGR